MNYELISAYEEKYFSETNMYQILEEIPGEKLHRLLSINEGEL